MKLKWLVLLGTPIAARAADAQTTLAICGEPKGKVHMVSPGRGWDNFRASGLAFAFMRDKNGRVDVRVGSKANLQTIRDKGVNVRLTHYSRDFSYFIINVIYQHAQVDTYQVTFGPDGKGRLLWSSLKSHMPPHDTTTGSLLVAECVR